MLHPSATIYSISFVHLHQRSWASAVEPTLLGQASLKRLRISFADVEADNVHATDPSSCLTSQFGSPRDRVNRRHEFSAREWQQKATDEKCSR